MNESQLALERFLADRSRQNRDALITAFRYLCVRGARKFRRPESDPADLRQVAAIGLIKAVDSYRSERQTPFEAYAWLLVVGELMHYVRDHERLVRLPRSYRALELRYGRAWERLAAETSAEPTPQQLAADLNVSLETIDRLTHARHGNVSLDTPVRTALAAAPTVRAQRELAFEKRVEILDAVDALSHRERVVVIGTFGADLPQKRLARDLGLSQSQISKILGRALEKLQENVA
jgi:RNA polymerase sigma-B factor